MDWSKAKTILIIALLATNLFLIFTYGFKNFDKSQGTNEVALLTILEERGIVINTEIPKSHKAQLIIQGEYASYSNEKLEEIMTIVDEYDDIEGYISMASYVVKELDLWCDTMVFEFNNDFEQPTVTIKNRVGDMLLEGSYIKCIFSKGQLIDFQCKWLIPIEFSSRKVETVSAAVALMSVTNPNENSILIIDDIEMVYWIPDTDIHVNMAVSDTAFPTWKITSQNGKEFFIEAVQR